MHVRKAIFPVAGLGTRFLPATKSVPKEMLPLVDRPLIQYAVDEARAAGIEEFIFVTARGKSALEDYFDDAPALEAALEAKGKLRELEELRRCTGSVRPVFVRQGAALGLGHAVACARHLVGDEPVAVLLPDDVIAAERPCLLQMVEAHAATGGSMVATASVPLAATASYGVIDVAEDMGRLVRAAGLVEKPAPGQAPSTLAVIGRYILSPAVMRALDGLAPGAGGEIQLTDAIRQSLAEDHVYGYRFDGTRYDCGAKHGFLQATVAFAMARPDMRAALCPQASAQERAA